MEKRLWRTDVAVIALATTKEEAKENIRKGYVVVDDIPQDVEPVTMNHLRGECRDNRIRHIVRILSHREQLLREAQHPAGAYRK